MAGLIKKHRSLYLVSLFVLTLSFTLNVFGVQSIDWFSNFQKDSGALIVHKLACEEELGRDEFGGMLVVGKDTTRFSVSERAPVCQKDNAKVYVSQYGLQGKVGEEGYKVAHKLLGLNLAHFLILAQVSWALLTAVVLALFIVWVADRFGMFTGGVVLVLLGMSVWIVGYARNLYWATPLLFLPFVFTLYYYQKPKLHKPYALFITGLFVLFFVRFLNGYEFAPEIILAPLAAMSYLIYARSTSLGQFVKEAVIVCMIGVTAFVGAFALSYYQVYRYVGDSSKAFSMIKERAVERTGDSRAYGKYVYDGLGYTLPSVYSDINNYIDLNKAAPKNHTLLTNGLSLLNYALLPVLNIPISLKEPLYTVVSSFSFVAIISWMAVRSLSKNSKGSEGVKYRALMRAMWVGLIGSLSWLVLAHSHSFVHAHLNGIIFYLPFLLFAYIALGLWLEQRFDNLKARLRSAR